MNSTSHADNMIPLVGTRAKRKNTTEPEYDWEREVKHILLDFHVPRDEITICSRSSKLERVSVGMLYGYIFILRTMSYSYNYTCSRIERRVNIIPG